MIRWTNTNTDPMGQFESLLVGLSADDRDQAVALWSKQRILTTNRVARRRDAQQRQRVASLCWGIVTVVLVFGLMVVAGMCDSPVDHVGPDERRHLAAGHRIGGSFDASPGGIE